MTPTERIKQWNWLKKSNGDDFNYDFSQWWQGRCRSHLVTSTCEDQTGGEYKDFLLADFDEKVGNSNLKVIL